LTTAEGRKFGLTVGGAFLVISAVVWWRDHLMARNVFVAVGGALFLAGILVPTHLGPVFRAWMGFAHAISKVTTPIFMGVVYFLVIFPTGVVVRLFGRKPLRHAKGAEGYWQVRAAREDRHSDMTRQF